MTALARPRPLLVLAIVSLVVVLSLGAFGCQRRQPQTPTPTPQPTGSTQPSSPPPAPTPTASPSPTSSPTTPVPPTKKTVFVRVYLVRGEKIGVAGRSLQLTDAGVAKQTMTELLKAPNASDAKYRLTTAIPKGTALLGLSIRNGTATVNLSNRFQSGGGSLSMQLRVAQVVGTLQQFPTVKRVAFKIDGKAVKSIGGEGVAVSPPVKLGDFENVLPAILVEGPTPGQAVTRGFRLFGTANVFEAQFNMRLVQDGVTLVSASVMATSGTGTRGTFSKSIRWTGGHSGNATLEVYDISQKDGSKVDLVRIPVTLK